MPLKKNLKLPLSESYVLPIRKIIYDLYGLSEDGTALKKADERVIRTVTLHNQPRHRVEAANFLSDLVENNEEVNSILVDARRSATSHVESINATISVGYINGKKDIYHLVYSMRIKKP
jgi:hypothetical protein